ncbi:TPA: hypothetical protein ACSQ2O_003492, partial [Klebsiella michiganensis]
MSENNYGALMMKSTFSASVDIDVLIFPGIYSVPVSNHPSLGGIPGTLIIYSGKPKRRVFTSNDVILATSIFDESTSSWEEWDFCVSRKDLANVGDNSGGKYVYLPGGETVQDAIKFITPLLKPGIENAEYNYTILQEAANKNQPLDLPKGDFYISQAFEAGKGQIIRGQGSPNFSPNCYTRLICMTEGGGCIWYTRDSSTGQVRMPQIYDMGLTGDYPVRFNNEQTAIIKDDVSLSNVPFGMVPVVSRCAINPRVNGTGIGISWSKMFDGAIEFCEIANFDIDLLLNGCDLNKIAHNRIRNGWRYMVLELSASTFGSQNEIHHNDILHAGSPNCIMVKTTARHARIYDNYLEQATGTDREA